jgi:hypothetical protein
MALEPADLIAEYSGPTMPDRRVVRQACVSVPEAKPKLGLEEIDLGCEIE